ncbi:hypothetical protein LZK98_08310 [Sphingomonas cannabina]|uniref:hypothetical protein n=1 Tax=Sphingomonas cannabina TaxID=2899123 RepID=UPI001F456B1F|nr:hypothetical protein [Sphingomonas cannabina]UIJ46932.1 hypothetical protein LZK98_08310 [Sphingomonas cannabina]
MTPEPLISIVRGSGHPAPGAISALALRLADFASRLGFRVGKIEASRFTNSNSRYLNLFDKRGHRWLIRVSDHGLRRTNHGRPIPHVSYTSLDGEAGYDEVCRILGRIVAGGVDWRDPNEGVRQPRRARLGRRYGGGR